MLYNSAKYLAVFPNPPKKIRNHTTVMITAEFLFRENTEKERGQMTVSDSRSCSRQSEAVGKPDGGPDSGELADIAEHPEAEVISVR